MPLLATAIVQHIGSLNLITTWDDNQAFLYDTKNSKFLKEIHGISTVLKAVTSF